MKILQNVLLLVLFSLTTITTASAENVVVTDEALQLILDIQVEDVYAMPNRASYDPYYVLKDTPATEAFMDLPELEYVPFKYEEDGIKYDFVQFNDPYYHTEAICTSFVSAMIDGDISEDHQGITRMVRGSNLPTGTVLSTFPKKALPGEKQKIGHIVVLLKVKADYIWVIDQNASYENVVAVHKIYFKGFRVEGNHNAYQYYSIEKK